MVILEKSDSSWSKVFCCTNGKMELIEEDFSKLDEKEKRLYTIINVKNKK